MRGDQLWIDAQLYGPHENDAWVFDLARTKWSQHTSSVFKVVWHPSINAGVPGAPSKIPPPRGRGYSIVITGAFVLPPMRRGMIDASATRNPRRPWTRSSGSTTASGPMPIRHVPTG